MILLNQFTLRRVISFMAAILFALSASTALIAEDKGRVPDPLAGLSQKQRAFIEKEFPFYFKYVGNLKASGSEDAIKELRELARKVKIDGYTKKAMKLKEKRPELFAEGKKVLQLELKSKVLANKIRSMPEGEKRQKKVEKLRLVLEDAFDVNQQVQIREAAELNKELKEIRSLIKKRTKSRERIITLRLNKLTGVVDELEW